MFERTIANLIQRGLGKPGTALILYGPRQSGKTTLMKHLLRNQPDAVTFVGDDLFTQSLLSRHELEHLKGVVGTANIIFVDEAQRIENIGLTMKLLLDHLPVSIVASGSASFELADRLSEPLTGRARVFHLYPLSWEELSGKYRVTAPDTALEEMLRFGMYPRVHTLQDNLDKEEYLYNYVNQYLYRDILEFEQIKKPKKVVDLLVLLAHQIGREVAISELATSLHLTQKTVESYLDVLEKMFVIINLRGFSRNLRKEVTKTSRYYFTDVGVRNTLLRSFVPLSLRNDGGVLFENWFVMERFKRAANHRLFTRFFFWRTYDQHEIDLVEDLGGKLMGFECKWSPRRKTRAPKDWFQHYPDAGYRVVTGENWKSELGDTRS